MNPSAIALPSAVLIDIEGTVGSIRFVKDVLFPFARERLRDFVSRHRDRPDVAAQLDAVAQETGQRNIDAQIEVLEQWSDADRKATPLKALQGMIWDGGYRSGALTAHLYEDAVEALRRWQRSALPVYVYSSGSIAAQKLYFSHTAAGDLSAAIAGYFDTTTGPKQQRESYTTIAKAIGFAPQSLVFLSDIGAELVAAAASGFHSVQVRREGVSCDAFEPSVTSFAELRF